MPGLVSRHVGLSLALALAVTLPARAGVDKVTVTGEVIDSACYIKIGVKGEAHRECAQKCADAGIPLALLEDGTGIVIWLVSVADQETPNRKLREHAGRKVTITGWYVERGGTKLLEVESIQPGQPFWVALRLKMDPGWHTYWKNPGDSGLPTKIQ